MSTASNIYVPPVIDNNPTSLRLKLRTSEQERGRLEAQLSATENLHARERWYLVVAGACIGVVVTMATLALLGAFR